MTALVSLVAAGCAGRAPRGPAPMTIEEYAKVEHRVPYVLTLGTGDEPVLVYYGAAHLFDPSSPMFRHIEEHFRRARPAVLLNEGGHPPALDDRDEAIRRHGEAGLVRHLAKKHRLPVDSLDLPLEDEARALRAHFDRREVLLYLVLRQLGSWNELPEKPEYERYFARFLRRLANPLTMPSVSMRDVAVEYRRVFGRDFVPGDVTRELTDPMPGLLLTQRISRVSTRLRDEHMIAALLAAQRSHGRVFAVVGASHVVMQERVLRARLSAPRAAGTPPAPR